MKERREDNMAKKISRRHFLKTVGTGLAVGAAVSSAPFMVRRSYAGTKTLRFLGAENVTGNWDPTANTTLANILIEMQTFNHCIFFPMIPGTDPLIPINEIVENIKMINPFVAEYKVRKGIKFHDGKDCLAEDIKASLEYASTPGRPRGVIPGAEKLDVKVVDSHTAMVSSEAKGIPLNNSLNYLHPYVCIMSARDIAEKNIEKTINGTGPFKFVAQEGDSTILEANPDYYLGRPKIDRLVFSYVPDSTTRVMSLLSGEAQMIERLEAEQFQSLSKNAKLRLTKTVSIENKYLHFRCNKKPFDDPRVRRAACHAIDRSAIVELMGESGTAVNNIMPRGKIGYSDLTTIPEYDPQKCQQLLAEAGYPKGEGLPELEYITSTGFYPKTKEYGEVIQALMQEQGFPVKLTVHEPAAWNERIYNLAEGHMVDCGWAATGPEPGVHLNLLWNNPPALQNGLNDKDVNASITKQLKEPDFQKRIEILKTETYPLLVERAPSLALFTSVMLHGMTKQVEGVHIYPDGSFNLLKADVV
jgi:peptide/nickel transport system substrate-binding protein